ncbi:MAG TPA: SHOCT domain-containing protein [Solirubrobacterales bacterium]|jgi:hypothetical protein|nr:SHOCT domain-containing protein [Solirubrobacterales bacterium]
MPLPRKRNGSPTAPAPRPLAQSTEAERAEALEKLKSLFDSGVLTEEQYESERRRLTRHA